MNLDTVVAASAFLLTQLGVLVWLLSDIRTDLKELRNWVTRLDERSNLNGRNIASLLAHEDTHSTQKAT